jgi:hypothetical protein
MVSTQKVDSVLEVRALDVRDRVFQKRRFYDVDVNEDIFGTIVEKAMIGTIPIFLVKWDNQRIPLQYTENNLIPAILHEKYKEAVSELLNKRDK